MRSGMARVVKDHSVYLHIHTFIHERDEPYVPLLGGSQLVPKAHLILALTLTLT